MFRDLVGLVGEWARRLVGVVLCLLPSRHWGRFESFPITRLVAAASVLTILSGAILGAGGYIAYIQPATAVTNTAALNFAEKQIRGQAPANVPIEMATLRMLSMFSFFGYVFFTPSGLLSTYMVTTGCLRFLSYVVDEPLGDPTLTALDALVLRSRTSIRRWQRRRARERQEGPERPDYLVTGAWAGVAGADYVVIASRQKPGWTSGTLVVTRETWFRLGQPFDFRSPEGLRTAYPLTVPQTTEVLRRSVRYELPPLETPPGRARPTSSASS